MPLCVAADVRALDVRGTDFPDPPFTDAFFDDIVIPNAEILIDETCWDVVDAPKACALLAAHFAVELGKGGSASVGQVTAEAAGGLSRSYAAVVNSSLDGSLGSTPYGQQFILIRNVQVCGYVPLVLT